MSIQINLSDEGQASLARIIRRDMPRLSRNAERAMATAYGLTPSSKYNPHDPQRIKKARLLRDEVELLECLLYSLDEQATDGLKEIER